MPSAASRRHRFGAGIFAGAVAVACAVPAVAAEPPASIKMKPNTAGSRSKLALEANPSQSQGGNQEVKSLTLLGPRGLKVDPRARAERCSPAQARDSKCPSGSKIGSGQASGHASGAIVPGGQQSFTADVEAFLAPPVKDGDIAGAVLQISEQQSGTKGSVTGRIVRVRGSKKFGVKLRFEDFPSTTGVTVTVEHMSLLVGARRGKHSLLTNPAKCRGGSWPFRVEAGYADHTDGANVAAACRKG